MVSSERTPNESYAQRAKKANTSSSAPRTTLQKPPPNVTSVSSSSLKPPQVNVWSERIREQKAGAAPQPAQMPRQRAASSPQPPRDDAIQPRSSPPDLSNQLAILDLQDEHDPFVIRVPPHLSRQSSSSTNPLPATDLAAWPNLPSADLPSYDPSFLSVAPSRQNSTASVRHHVRSPSGGSARLPRTQSSFSQHSYSASQSRVHSRSGSSASSPRLQIRGRTLPQDDPPPPDLRLDNHLRRSSNKRSSPALPDPPNHTSSSLQVDSTLPTDPSYYPRLPVSSLQDMPARYAHNFLSQFTLPPQFPSTHPSGHSSPPYVSQSGQGTPYPHYPPYPAYMYGHPSLFWGDVASPNHVQIQPPNPSNHLHASEHGTSHKIEFGSISPAVVTTESSSVKDSAQVPNGLLSKPSKNVVFGTINVPESQDNPNTLQLNQGVLTDTATEHVTEQFATFSIGMTPDEPVPSRLASRKSSARSLSKMTASQPANDDVPKDANNAPPPVQKVNGIKKPIKWEFGTTLSEDLNDTRAPSPPSPTSLPPANHQDGQPAKVNARPSHDISRPNHQTTKSDTGSPTSDIWVVRDYGYGFGNTAGSGNAPEVVRWEVHERERGREQVRESHRELEIIRDQYRERGWVPPRQHGWRHENGVEEGREGWEQQVQVQVDTPRHIRPRRGSFPGYGGHERGGFSGRRGRGFGGRYHNGRGRGGFFYHQRPGSYPYSPAPPQPQPPPPQPQFELAPGIDMINGYTQPPYALPELESYEAIPQPSLSRVPFTPAAYSVDAMRSCLLMQLEYYLSPQNMAQDLYLRQRMDDEGWIPISLLASFKRVRQLQTDSEFVREVLSQSGLFEVSGDWVRMGGRQWELFVLPNAPRSVVTGTDHIPDRNLRPVPHHHDDETYGEPDETTGEQGETEGDFEGEDCEVDEEEDEIEFVIGEEAEESWMPVPERKA